MKLPGFIQERVPLAALTTYRVGGPARWLAAPGTVDELAQAVAAAERLGVPVLMLGGGSNILVADAGVEAMVVRLAGGGEFDALHPAADGHSWRVGAALGLQAAVARFAGLGLAGPELLAGIPGSVGGAAAMNAGGREWGIGRFVTEASVFEPGQGLRTVAGSELAFSYRDSTLRGRIVLSLTLRFAERGDPAELAARIRHFRERKAASQPIAARSAGCVFRNPPNAAAGALLDAAGCKGMRVGGAAVSRVHANFIENSGGATARDVALLAVAARERVRAHAGVLLRPEIVSWGDEPALLQLYGEG